MAFRLSNVVNGTARRAAAIAVATATIGGALMVAPSAQADSVGYYIGLTGNVTFSESQPHTWRSTSVHLAWQTDGNLVIYCNNSGKAIWASGSEGLYSTRITFADGEILISYTDNLGGWYSAFEVGDYGSQDHAYIQNDGNFVVYRPNGGVAWASGSENKC